MMAKVLRIDKKLPETWEEALQEFLLWKQGQNVSPRTLEDYKEHVTRFFTRYPDAYSPDTVRRCVLEYMAQPVAPATFNLRREYLGGFFSWCVREGLFPENPLYDIPKKKDRGRIRHLPEEVLQKLLTLPDRKTFAGLRDYALMLLTLATGIRPCEALSLLPKDINLRSLSVTIERQVAKTREERTVPIPPPVAEAIKELLAARHPAWSENAPVFCSCSGRKMTTEAWGERLVDAYGKRLGDRTTPYMLRHSFAIETLKAGGNAFTVQHMMGHSTMEMTKRYVRLVESDLREAMARANPLDRIMPQQHRIRKVRG